MGRSTRQKMKLKASKQVVEDQNDKSLHSINNVLPTEMLEQIFRHLGPKDLKTVMLVCKLWNTAAESPALWSWVTFTWPQEHKRLTLESLLKAMRLKRLQNVTHMKIEGDLSRKNSWQMLLTAVLQHPGLKKFTDRSQGSRISTEHKDLLIEVLANMEEVKLDMFSNCTTALYAGIQRPNKLKKLTFYPFDIMDPTLPATGHNKIEHLKVGLAEEQANLMLKAIQDETSSVKSLSLACNIRLSKLDPTLLFGAFDKLVGTLELDGEHLPSPQPVFDTLCKAIAAGTNLKRLHLVQMDLSQVDPQLLARVVTQMQRVMFQSCRYQIEPIYGYVTSEQYHTMFEAIAEAPKNLKKLIISPIPSDIDADLLACAANTLAVFEGYHLSVQQAEAILSCALLGGTSLKKLLLSDVDGEEPRHDLISAAEKVIPEVLVEKTIYDSCSGSEYESDDPDSDSDSELDSGF